MNSQVIKVVVAFLVMVFLVVATLNISYDKSDDALLKFHIEVSESLTLSKDRTLELNNAYRSNYLNYDKLTNSNRKLLDNVQKLTLHYPKNSRIKQIKNIINQQDEKIDLIKRTNSIINNSQHFIKHFRANAFINIEFSSENVKQFRKLSRKLVDTSNDIKMANSGVLHDYRSYIKQISALNFYEVSIQKVQKTILSHATVMLENALIMQNNLNEFNVLEKSVNFYYLDLKKEIQFEHEKIQQKIKYLQIVLLILLVILIALILRFIQNEKLHRFEQKKLQDMISKNIITSTTDLKGIITSASDAFCEISGFSRKELIGTNHNISRHPDMPKSAFKAMWGTIQAGKVWRGRVKNIKKDGGYYWVDAIIEPIFDKQGRIEAYMSIRVDISDKVKLDELTKAQEQMIKKAVESAEKEKVKALNAVKAKGDFLANMSHEIRTPLNGILGFVDILKENIKAKENQEYLKIIDNSSHHLLGIINDILDYSKIESGKLDIEKVNFDIKEEFSSTIDLFKAKASEKHIYLDISFDKDLPKVIIADPLRLKQIISNLLSNAIKFTKDEHSISTSIRYKDNLLIISVKDGGIGIAASKLEHIFEAFSQEDSTTTRKFGGTGLGLSICKELVTLMRGTIEVKSKLGVGSEFTFSVPVQIGKEIAKEKKEVKEINFKGKRLLLVEDNESNVMFMKVILKKLGFTFDVAYDGYEAIEAFKKNDKYDFILMDENMPNMGGIASMKVIKEIEKDENLEPTIIIALTANALKGDRERFLSAGMDEYLTKPLKRRKLAETLIQFIK